jgi:GT2 family glycosyltransferase
MQKNEVYIIIVTYNGMKWLARCLESTKPYPVIVVDNNSTDGTIDFIKSHHPEIILFEQKENLGFGQANNIGISYALKEGADYVFLLNQDAYLGENCIKELVAVERKNQNFGILSPIHLNGQGNRLDKNFASFVLHRSNFNFYSDLILSKSLQSIYQVDFVNAAGWLVSKTCLKKVGGFDPIFFHYGEDENLCQRLKYHGFRIGICPNVFLLHDREYRSYNNDKITLQSQEEKKKERFLKIRYADLNHRNIDGFDQEMNKVKIKIFKNLVKCDFKGFRKYLSELKLLKRLRIEIINSRSKNLIEGTHYIKFK